MQQTRMGRIRIKKRGQEKGTGKNGGMRVGGTGGIYGMGELKTARNYNTQGLKRLYKNDDGGWTRQSNNSSMRTCFTFTRANFGTWFECMCLFSCLRLPLETIIREVKMTFRCWISVP